MKQHITEKQYDELSFEQREKLFQGLFVKEYTESRSDGTVWRVFDVNYKYITIGRMIEFLREYVTFEIHMGKLIVDRNKYISKPGKAWHISYLGGPCDALWKVIKEINENI